jgi:bacterioferritin (cytochrome b1)
VLQRKDEQINQLQKELSHELDSLKAFRKICTEAMTRDKSAIIHQTSIYTREKKKAKKRVKRANKLLDKIAGHPSLNKDATLRKVQRKLKK